ncbi:MAG: zinc ribbon domain-containing protein [Syntrophales bacterium]
MPTYEYACKTCNKKFSVVQSIAERDKMKVSCPKCKSRKVDQLVSSLTTKTSRKS